jgi:hypothetical protein
MPKPDELLKFSDYCKGKIYLIGELPASSPQKGVDEHEELYTKLPLIIQLFKYINKNFLRVLKKYGKEKPNLFVLAYTIYKKSVELHSTLLCKEFKPPKSEEYAIIRENSLIVMRKTKKLFRKYRNIVKVPPPVRPTVPPKIVIKSDIIDKLSIQNIEEKDKTNVLYQDLPSSRIYGLYLCIVILYCLFIIYLERF